MNNMNNMNKSKILLVVFLGVIFAFINVFVVNAWRGGANSMPNATDSAGKAVEGKPPAWGSEYYGSVGLKAKLVMYQGNGSAPVQIGESRLLINDYGKLEGTKGERQSEEDSIPVGDLIRNFQYHVNFPGPTQSEINAIGRVFLVPGKLPSLTDGGVANYLENTGGILDSYFANPSQVTSMFGARVDYTQIDKYYVIFEPVYKIYKWPSASEGKSVNPSCSFSSYVAWKWVSWYSYSCQIDGKYDDSVTDRSSCEAQGGTYVSQEHQERVPTEELYDCPTIEAKPAKLSTARSGGANLYLKALFSGFNEKNKYPARNSKGELIPGQVNYFVGPLAQNALVAEDAIFNSSNNFYRLVPDYVAASARGGYSDTNGSYAVGMGIYNLATLMKCREVCSGLYGDNLLQCAESYCDNSDYDDQASPTDPKGSCIRSCGYNPEVDSPPMKCDSDNDPYKNVTEKNVADNSQCSLLGNGTPTGDNDGVVKSCYEDTTTIFDQKTYINVSCVERTNFTFTDFSRKRFVAGQGIDYNTRLRGKKECAIFFDINSWKYDFATIHSEDVVRKDRLLKLVEAYNNLLEISSSDPIDGRNTVKDGKTYSDGISVGSFFTGDTGLKLSDLYYDESKVDVKSKVTEVINNALSNEGMRVYGSSSFVSLIKKALEKSSTFVISGKDETVGFKGTKDTTWFEGATRNNPIKIKVNRYTNSSYVQKDFEYPAVCISNDGKATTSLAPANGICYTSGSGAGTTNVFARNSYYTSLNATSNKDFIKSSFEHKFDTVATAQSDGGGNYVEDTEACPYEIDDDNLECEIEIVMDSGTATEGNDVYLNGGVTANLLKIEHLGVGDQIESFGIAKGSSESLNGESTLHLGPGDKEAGKDYIDITGVVESTNGKKAVCKRRVTLATSNCGASCTITKYDDKLYELIPSGGGQYFAGLSTSLNWGNTNWAEIKPRDKDNKILIKVENDAVGTYVLGKVSNGVCSSICSYKVDDSEKQSCQELFVPAQTGEIKEYCDSNWYNDKSNYSSATDCVNKCSNARMCPDNRRDINEVTNSCTSNYRSWGFSNRANCINYCYYCPECDTDYIYRPVNNFNPFPNSYDSNTLGFTYPTGKRIVPANWVGKTQYIKQDDDDTSSVTGQNANQRVEYVIELSPEAIREIRRDTESYNRETDGNDAYLDYVYMSGVDKTKRYYSKFINETFRSYFKMIDGVDV